MTIRSGIRLAAVVCLSSLLFQTQASWAAEPPSASIGEREPSASWIGSSFDQAAVDDAGACSPDADPDGVLCDHFTLTLDLDDGYWKTHRGRVIFGIGWKGAEADFDLYAFDDTGAEVAASTDEGTMAEQVTIVRPVGSYELRVVPVDVVDGGYVGWASFSSQPIEPKDETGSGSDAGGGSGGDGGAAGGGADGTSDGTEPADPPSRPPAHTSASGAPGDIARPAGGSAFAAGPYASRSFDSRLGGTSANDAGDVGRATPSPATPVPSAAAPAASPPPTPSPTARPVELTPAAARPGRLPGSAWIGLALGVLGLALTALAVFERGAWTRRPPAARGRDATPPPGATPRAGTEPAVPTA